MPKEDYSTPDIMSTHNENGFHHSGFDPDEAINRIAHWLPTQNPLKDFVHHNTLHAVQNRSFPDAIAIASRIYGAKSSLPVRYFQERKASGRIYDFALDKAVDALTQTESEKEALFNAMLEANPESHYPPPSLAHNGIRQKWLTKLALNLDAIVHPVLFRLISNFLDQGISHWPIANPDESLWECVVRLVHDTFIPLYPLNEPEAREWLLKTPEEAILHCLQRLVGDETLYGTYLLEMSLAHPGWSGMVRIIERQPDALLFKRRVNLKEFMAVELMMQLAVMNMKRGPNFRPLALTPPIGDFDSFAHALTPPAIPIHVRAWQESMEFSLYAELLAAIRDQDEIPPQEIPPQIQALFCIDDRECSIRRHIEEVNPDIETFGAAGFFGIEFLYKGINDLYPVAQCPVIISPEHLVIEKPLNEEGRTPIQGKRAFKAGKPFKNWVTTQTIGLTYAVRLALDVFTPGTYVPAPLRRQKASGPTKLHLLRESESRTPEGKLLGFTHEEMADRLERLFVNIGLTERFARRVVVVAHGASSSNNPHFAAYDCGACSGKPGAPNARAFAAMANDPSVRALLTQRGITIPSETRFIPALHNTTRDEIEYYDLGDEQSEPSEEFSVFRDAMKEALLRNAHERCRWFELGPAAGKPKAAAEHVKLRASSIFEPRPELNHSNNLYCIVGQRSLTRRLFMDRRAFLHSYDPSKDPEGEILARVLSQVIPVCGGINLEYYFSSVDNSIYGAGTKLPHNVVGLLGVANGVEGDLRTGLPSQMIEVHEPARLLIAVEQTTAIIDQALKQIGPLKEWLDHQWVRLVAVNPSNRHPLLLTASGWEDFGIPENFDTPRKESSRAVYEGQDKTIRVHIIDPVPK